MKEFNNFILSKKNIVIAVTMLFAFSIILIFFISDRSMERVERIDIEGSIGQENISDDGAWCWFQDPRAVSYNGKTYVGWVNRSGDIVISRYDNQKKETVSNVLHYNLQIDDHSAPTILILQDGRIMVFYSAHVGNAMFYRISISPEDISNWSEEKRITTNTEGKRGYTYSHPVRLSDENNKIYLFWRGGDFKPNFSTSIDGVEWSNAQNLFDVPNERPYMKVFSNGSDKIYFTFTDGHPNEIETNNIYFTYYQDGSFYKADGTFIKGVNDLPLVASDLDVVYDSNLSGVNAWNWDIAIDNSGNPVIAYATFPALEDHRYNYAYWDGESWNNYEIAKAGGSIDKDREPFYSGGMAINHQDPSIVYLSREINEMHEMEKWETPDWGKSWSSKIITSQSLAKNVRPVVPRNYN
ncbi:MAG: BNR-4 repeat-containing protein [Parcubacteria group bacterium]